MAAQFLSGQGFREVYNLKGGIQAWQGLKARGPVELNLDLIRGDETQEEMVVIAYGLEKALEEFYRDSAREGLEEALLNLFRTLAAAEERHQRLLTDLLPGLAGRTEAGPKEEGPAALMEGGFRSGEFRRENQSFLSTPSGVLDLAMMIETQALDLYLRFAQKIVAEAVRAVLYRLADEEKNHLKALGRYRDQGQDTAPEAP